MHIKGVDMRSVRDNGPGIIRK